MKQKTILIDLILMIISLFNLHTEAQEFNIDDRFKINVLDFRSDYVTSDLPLDITLEIELTNLIDENVNAVVLLRRSDNPGVNVVDATSSNSDVNIGMSSSTTFFDAFLAKGESAICTYVLRVNEYGEYVVTLEVPGPLRQFIEIPFQVLENSGTPELFVEKYATYPDDSIKLDSTFVGDTIEYSIVVGNIGDAPLMLLEDENLELMDFFGDNLNEQNVDILKITQSNSEDQCFLPTQLVFDLNCSWSGIIPPGFRDTIRYLVHIKRDGVIHNRAIISKNCPLIQQECELDGNLLNNIKDYTLVSSKRSADITLNKSVQQGSSAVESVFTIQVKNTNSMNTALDVLVQDQLPDGLVVERATSPNGIVMTDGNTVSCFWSAIPPERIETIEIVTIATASGTFTNVAVIDSTTTIDPNPENDQDSATINISPLLEPPTIQQISYQAPFQENHSMEGLMKLVVNQKNHLQFVNVQLCNEDQSLCDWTSVNQPIPIGQGRYEIGLPINYSPLGFDTGQPIEKISFQVSITNEFSLNGNIAYTDPEIIEVNEQIFFLGGADDPELEEINPDETPILQDLVETPLIICDRQKVKMPNIDLDYSFYNPDNFPGYAGDKNACAPAATANSIHWLELIHPELRLSKSLGEKLRDLSNKMCRQDEKGTPFANIVKGKLHYLHENNMPVHVKFQSIYNSDGSDIKSPVKTDLNRANNKNTRMDGRPTWDFLVQEVKKGEDVELAYDIYKFKDNKWQRTGGHILTVDAVFEVLGKKYFNIVDDGDQSNVGGLRSERVEWGTSKNGIPLILFSNPGDRLRAIKYIISESYDKSVVHNIADLKLRFGGNLPGQRSIGDGNVGALDLLVAPSTKRQLLNILIDQEETRSWTLQNLILPNLDTIVPTRIWVDIPKQSESVIVPGDSLELHIGIDSLIATDMDFEVFYRPDVEVEEDQYILGDGSPDRLRQFPSSFPIIEMPTFTMEQEPQVIQLSGMYQTIDLNGQAVGNKSSWAQDGLAAIAQNLSYVTQNEDLLEEIEQPIEIFESLLSDSLYQGKDVNSIIQNTLNFIDDRKLSIGIRFQTIQLDSGNILSPDMRYGHEALNESEVDGITLRWVKDQLSQNHPIQLEVGFYNESGHRVSGHWVSLIDITEIGNLNQISFRDDSRQDTIGGILNHISYWHSGSSIEFIYPYASNELLARVESAISFAYDPDVTFETTSTSEFEGFESISILPNPARDRVSIEGNTSIAGNLRVTLLNTLGQPVLQKTMTTFNGTFSDTLFIGHLHEGIYFILFGKIYYL